MYWLKQCVQSALVATLTVNLLSFMASASFCWASPVLPKLQSDDSTVNPLSKPTTVLQDSILASIIYLGAFGGILICGFIKKSLGQKNALLVSGIPMVISYLTFAFATNLYVFIVGRLICGLGTGLSFTLIPGYVSELADQNNRGLLGSFISIMGCLGQLSVFAVGPHVSIQVFSFLHLIPLAVFFAIFVFCPESPYKIVAAGNFDKAAIVLTNLRGTHDRKKIEQELSVINEVIERQRQDKTSYVDLITNKTLRKAVMISCVVFAIQQLSGLSAILSYMQNIFDAGNISLPSSITPVIVQSFFVASVLLFSQLVDKMGRKFWLVLSSFGIIASLGTLGVFFYLKSQNVDVTPVSWLPIVCIVFFVVSYSSGFLNIPWIIMGEYFPQSHQSEASSITITVCCLISAIVVFSFPFVAEAVGEYVTFWTFCGIVLIGIVFICCVIPETKGKSFLDIQNILSK